MAHHFADFSLRDHFAAQAIPPCISTRPVGFIQHIRKFLGWDYTGPKPKPEAVAIQAYRVADAMLAERAKKIEGDAAAEQAAKVERIAKVCHEVNRAYCASLGDQSQPSWFFAPAWQQESARKGVQFHLDNPTAGPEASHVSWSKQKVADGWVYGPVKDPDAKTHPCLVPFTELPREQQAKDWLFRAIVHALA